MKANQIFLEQSLLQELFNYENGKLYWIKNNQEAGCIHRTGYRLITIKGKQYTAHRLIWIYLKGSIDSDLYIDHINGVKDDNRIENLRLVTHQENCFNRSRLNSKGYTWNKSCKKWQAHIRVNQRLKYIGLFDSKEDARNAYLNAASSLHIIKEAV